MTEGVNNCNKEIQSNTKNYKRKKIKLIKDFLCNFYAYRAYRATVLLHFRNIL